MENVFRSCKWVANVIQSIVSCKMNTICFIAQFEEQDSLIRLYLDDLGFEYEVIGRSYMGCFYKHFYVNTKR